MNESKVKVGVIGLGLQGIRHVDAYAHMDDVELLSLCDINKERLLEVANKYGVKSIYTDYRDMIDREDIDAVSIALPDHLHKDPVVYALKHSKHVLCEKPLATNLEDIDEMLKVWNKRKNKFMVNFENRWNPPYRKLKQIIDENKIGEILHICGKLNATRDIILKFLPWAATNSSPGFFLMVHIIDLLRWYTNSEVEKVAAVGVEKFFKSLNKSTLDSIQVIMKFKTGATAMIESSWALPSNPPFGADFEINIVGTKSMALVNTTHQSISIINENGISNPEVFRLFIMDDYPYGFIAGAVKHFINCIKYDRQPLTTPYDGKIATAIILAINESIKEGKFIKPKCQ